MWFGSSSPPSCGNLQLRKMPMCLQTNLLPCVTGFCQQTPRPETRQVVAPCRQEKAAAPLHNVWSCCYSPQTAVLEVGLFCWQSTLLAYVHHSSLVLFHKSIASSLCLYCCTGFFLPRCISRSFCWHIPTLYAGPAGWNLFRAWECQVVSQFGVTSTPEEWDMHNFLWALIVT